MAKSEKMKVEPRSAPKALKEAIAFELFRYWNERKPSQRYHLYGMFVSAYLAGFWPAPMVNALDTCLDGEFDFFDISEVVKWLERLEKTSPREPADYCARTKPARRKKTPDGFYDLAHKHFGFEKVLRSFKGKSCINVPWRRLSWSLNQKPIRSNSEMISLTVQDLLAEDWTPVF